MSLFRMSYSFIFTQLAFGMFYISRIKSKIGDMYQREKIEKLLAKCETQYRLITRLSVAKECDDADGKPLLYFIHPSFAGCEVYCPLVSKLSDYRCFGVNNYNLHAKYPIDSLSVLATYYLAKLELPQHKSDKLVLLGWALGGKIALEMAYWLERTGYSNVQVILLDTALSQIKINTVTNEQIKRTLTRLGVKCQDKQAVRKFKALYYLEQKLNASKLSGSLKKTKVALLQARKPVKTRRRRTIAISKFKKMVINCNHFNLITKLADKWPKYRHILSEHYFEQKTLAHRFRLFPMRFGIGVIALSMALIGMAIVLLDIFFDVFVAVACFLQVLVSDCQFDVKFANLRV